MNLNKHIWEGWTAQDFINDLEWMFDRIMTGQSHVKPFATGQELKEWCKDNQPYYKKHIPEVYGYFKNRMKQINYI
jgi:hypothetical protein